MLLAFDISTSVIGFSVFNDDGFLIEMNCVKFKKEDTLFQKLEFFKQSIEHYNQSKVKYIGIEEPLKKFAGKFSNADTISKLNFFNGMISSFLYLNFGIEPMYIPVQTARKKSYPTLIQNSQEIKHEVWKRVVELEPKINWTYSKRTGKLMDENYDMSDSFTIGFCYLKILQERGEIIKRFQK